MSGEPVSLNLDRRSFLKASALAGAVTISGAGAGQALAQEGGDEETPDGALGTDTETVKSVCNYCAVGCGFKGERKGNAFVGQEPWHDNPINNGSLCSKGASIYGTEHSERRLKHPLRKEGGEWKRISWEEGYNQIVEEFERIWEEYSRDSIYWLGSAHHSNEEAYALRKLLAFLGTNNVDHQARICHSPTVAGLANTWGYGAMTNTINDYRNFDLNLIIGQNPAEAHPIAMQHILEGQKRGGTIINVEPRFTKTSAHADEYHRLRSGTDTAFILGLIRYLDEQGELDTETIEKRVQGWPDLREQLQDYDLETVADITWVDKEKIEHIGDLIIENKPNVHIEWAMGGTQHNNGTQNIRSFALSALASGGIGRAGGGMQVMRGHANIQGTTDLGPNPHILPGYYGVNSTTSWKHFANVWTKSPFTSGSVTYDELFERFDELPEDLFEQVQQGGSGTLIGDEQSKDDDRSMMFRTGMTVTRWYEGALDQDDRLVDSTLYQPDKIKAAVVQGHSLNSITEMDRLKKAMEELDLLVVIDVFPSLASVLADRDDGVILLPAASPYEHAGSVTNSHRSVQWKDTIKPPSHNAKPDLQIIQEFAEKFGFGEHFDWGEGEDIHAGKSSYEDALREINLGVRTIGYQQSPERLQQHKEHDETFSTEDLEAKSGPVEGDYWSLPWPCWGKGHPGTPILWRDNMDPQEGGFDFRARWGTKAPSPDNWDRKREEQGYPSEEYPLSATYEQQGEAGLNMLRDAYNPDWSNGPVRGVPEYPGFSTTLPDNPEEPTQLSEPYRFALSPDHSVTDAARAHQQAGNDFNHGLTMADYQQYDYKQPDPPTGRGRARAVAWNFFDPLPVHTEPIESPRPDLVEEWPASGKQTNHYRLDLNNRTVQKQATQLAQDQGFETIMTTGRQVEHQGGGSETRSNYFTADLQPHMYAEISPKMAEDKGIDGGNLVVVETTNRGSILVKARVTNRVDEREVFLPFHWGGVYKGKSIIDRYPEGTAPLAIGDSVNIITAPGYDTETQMQETKPSLVRVRKATREIMEDLNMDPDITFPQDEAGLGQQKDYDVRDHQTTR
ncbi:formate dehydrogenase [Halobacteriales archaeon QS_5_70_17]|nr:MAG: formate dehydrogenase [Halobacteriales archaeon QS_5_70_17]